MQSQNILQYLNLPAYQYAAVIEFISWICLSLYIFIALVRDASLLKTQDKQLWSGYYLNKANNLLHWKTILNIEIRKWRIYFFPHYIKVKSSIKPTCLASGSAVFPLQCVLIELHSRQKKTSLIIAVIKK